MNRWTKIGIIFVALLAISIAAYFLRAKPETIHETEITLSGDAPYYYMRQITYAANAFPSTMQKDPFMNFPSGSYNPWNPGMVLLYAGICKIQKAQTPYDRELVSAWIPTYVGLISILLCFFLAKVAFGIETAMITAIILAFLPAHIRVSTTGNINHTVWLWLILPTGFLFYIQMLGARAVWKTVLYGVLAGILFGFLPFVCAPAFVFLLIPLLLYFWGTIRELLRNWWDASYQIGHILCFLTALAGSFYFASIGGMRGETSAFDFGYFQAWFILYCSLTILFVSIASFVFSRRIVSTTISVSSVLFLFIVSSTIFCLLTTGVCGKVWAALSTGVSAPLWSLSYRQIFYQYTGIMVLALPGAAYAIWIAIQEEKKSQSIVALFLLAFLSSFFSQYFSFVLAFSGAILAALFIAFLVCLASSKVVRLSSAIVAVLLLGLAFCFTPEHEKAVSIPKDELAPVMQWVKDNLGKQLMGSKENPSSAILAHPLYGDWITYAYGIPTVANTHLARSTNHKGRKKWASFILTPEEEKVSASLSEAKIGYVLVAPNPDAKLASAILGSKDAIPSQITPAHISEMLASFKPETPETPGIYVPPTSYFRLIYASSAAINEAKYRIYEVVPGAILEGKTYPEAKLRITLPLDIKTDKGSCKLLFQAYPRADMYGAYKIVLPYSNTVMMGQLEPAKMYDIYNAGESKSFVVEEFKVEEKKIIRLNMIKD